MGATILPFRLLDPWLCVVPWDGERLLESADPHLDLYPGLAEWWTKAEDLWDEHKGENNLSLLEQIDYRRKLTLQFPVAQHRVLYAASGQYLAAARLEDERAVAEHALYWATLQSREEAHYLMAFLNSPALAGLMAPKQARGEHNPRHYDKLIWSLPIPLFDPSDDAHQQLVALAAQAEVVANAIDVSAKRTFQAQRRMIREALTDVGISHAIDTLVLRILNDGQ
jgi:hypothetical protein